MPELNDTHDPKRKSFVAAANEAGNDFPIQNLPLGVFSIGGSSPHGGVAIGDQILDIAAALKAGLFGGAARDAAEAASGAILNPLLSQNSAHWSALRARVSELLAEDGPKDDVAKCLVAMTDAEMHLPTQIGDYTDFYASINHATNAGTLFRPDNPLLPSYKHIPIAYHGRASSIQPSGEAIIRPNGQTKAPDADAPSFGPCKRLDYEMELAFYGGPGNALGTPISLEDTESHIFGLCLLNDWSARDIQAWEYQPLGPFLGKNFASTISPWIVTLEALAPYRTRSFKRPDGDPAPLPYLASDNDEKWGGLDIQMQVAITSAKMRADGQAPYVCGQAPFKDMYWTIFQMLAHHTSGGCDLRPGDLMGTGTVSGTKPGSYGSLLEISRGGQEPFDLPSGESRTFLEDGDEVIMSSHCEGGGYARLGFGDCRGIVLPARG
ncbi:MAG: fumarylacetoacetase [Rhodospirillales bacterium]|nr:fumarylacetoacetase [Rhodospirillales bacterium]